MWRLRADRDKQLQEIEPFSIARAADVRLAGERACMNVAFIRIGFSGSDMGSSYVLPRLVGVSRADLAPRGLLPWLPEGSSAAEEEAGVRFWPGSGAAEGSGAGEGR